MVVILSISFGKKYTEKRFFEPFVNNCCALMKEQRGNVIKLKQTSRIDNLHENVTS